MDPSVALNTVAILFVEVVGPIIKRVTIVMKDNPMNTYRARPNKFYDDRCGTCNHASEQHYAGDGKCFKCPAERRCMEFVNKRKDIGDVASGCRDEAAG